MNACEWVVSTPAPAVAGILSAGGESLGYFSADREERRHYWAWIGPPWPQRPFSLAFDPVGPSPQAGGCDVYPVPAAHLSRPRAVAATASRLYTVWQRGVVVATLGVEAGALHWLEASPGVLEMLGHGILDFIPSKGEGLARMSRARTQRPISLAATCGRWPVARRS